MSQQIKQICIQVDCRIHSKVPEPIAASFSRPLIVKCLFNCKLSDEANLVDRIFETSDASNHQRLIVTFIKPNAKIQLSNSVAEMHKAELDSWERQPNDRINITQPIFQ